MLGGSKKSVKYSDAREIIMSKTYHQIIGGDGVIPIGTIVYQINGADSTAYDHESNLPISDKYGKILGNVVCSLASLLPPIYKGEGLEVTFGHCEDLSFIIRRDGDKYAKYSTHNSANKVNTSDIVAMNKAKLKRKTYLRKKGYFESREEAVASIDKIVACSLLRKWDDVKGKVEYPLIGSPKLDGIRATIYGEPIIMSRGGKELIVPHILSELGSAGEPDQLRNVDGELWIPDTSLEKIQSIVTKANHPDKGLLHYFIFDIPVSFQFYHRLEELNALKPIVEELEHVHILPQVVLTNEAEANRYYDDCIAAGHEGVCYRTLKGTYVGGRTPEIIKRKPMITEEFQIINTTRDKNDLVIFVLKAKNGTSFKSVPAWEVEERKKDYRFSYHGDGYLAEVTYYDVTDKGVPKFSNVRVLRAVDNGKLIY